MNRIINHNKREIISELEMMKDLELTAKELYLKIANSPEVTQQRVKDAFTTMAQDEQGHADIVQKIINIVTNTL